MKSQKTWILDIFYIYFCKNIEVDNSVRKVSFCILPYSQAPKVPPGCSVGNLQMNKLFSALQWGWCLTSHSLSLFLLKALFALEHLCGHMQGTNRGKKAADQALEDSFSKSLSVGWVGILPSAFMKIRSHCGETAWPQNQWQNKFLSSFVQDENLNVACEFVHSILWP